MRPEAMQEITDFPESTAPGFPEDPAEPALEETALNGESTGPAEPAFPPEQPKAEPGSRARWQRPETRR